MFNKINKYGDFNSFDLLKNIAFCAMLLDHIGFYLYPHSIALRLIGRIAFIIYAMIFGSHYKKPSLAILGWGCCMTFIDCIFGYSWLPLNMLLTFFISGFVFSLLQKEWQASKTRSFFYLLPVLPLTILTYHRFQYGIMAPFFMLAGSIAFKDKEKNIQDYLYILLLFLIYFIYQNINFGFVYGYRFVFLMELGALYYMVINFKFTTYPIKNKMALLVSRYSLQLYVIHITLLIITLKYLL